MSEKPSHYFEEGLPHDDVEQPALNRRDFLKGMAATLTGVMADPDVVRAHEETTERKTYRSGETIEDPISDVRIEGWMLLLEKEKVDKIAQTNSAQRTVKFGALNKETGDQLEVVDKEFAESLTTVKRPGGSYVPYLMFPSTLTRKDQIVFVDRKGQDDKIAATKRYYDLELEKYPYRDGEIAVVSEGQVDREIARRITALARPFQPYLEGQTMTFYMPKARTELGLVYDGAHRTMGNLEVIMITDDNYTAPKLPTAGDSMVFHECAHGVIEQCERRAGKEKNTAFDRFTSAYKRLMAYCLLPVPFPEFAANDERQKMEKSENFELLSLFDESSYVGDDSPYSRIGHPYDNQWELFSSLLTVMRFYPDQMLQRYKKFDQTTREELRNVIYSGLACLKELNKDQRFAWQLIPAMDKFTALK